MLDCLPFRRSFLTILLVAFFPVNRLPAPEPRVIHDGLIKSRFSDAGVRLMKDKRAISKDKVAEQLNRTSCAVTLIPTATRRVTGVELVRSCRPGVLIVGGVYKCGKCEKWHTSTATGFALSEDGVFATCYHVLKSDNKEAHCVMTEDGKVYSVTEILAADEAADVAICRAEGARFVPLSLASDNLPEGEAVSVISHPVSRFYTLTEGKVSRYFMLRRTNGKHLPFMEITADFAKGSSGGPVLDSRGNVVGMAASTQSIYYDVKDGRKDNLQMVIKQCVPVSAIRALIK